MTGPGIDGELNEYGVTCRRCNAPTEATLDAMVYFLCPGCLVRTKRETVIAASLGLDPRHPMVVQAVEIERGERNSDGSWKK